MRSVMRDARYGGILAAVTVAAIAGFFAGNSYVSRSVSDDNTRFIETQNGHSRRLDRGSSDGRIVFLGSSTFQGLDTSAVTPVGLNLSVSGDTLSNLVRRASECRSLATARAVIINIGLNDLSRRATNQKPRSSHCLLSFLRLPPLSWLASRPLRRQRNLPLAMGMGYGYQN